MNDKLIIKEHIKVKRYELDKIRSLWINFLDLNKVSMFTDQTYSEVQSKVSSQMNQIERSILDHEKLLYFYDGIPLK